MMGTPATQGFVDLFLCFYFTLVAIAYTNSEWSSHK